MHLYKSAPREVWLMAIFMASVDVGANIAMLQSFEHTSAISAVLISSTSSIIAVPLSYFILKARYNMYHGFGILVVICGLVLINISKMHVDSDDTDPSAIKEMSLWGSSLALMAAFGYALTAVIQTKVIELFDDDGYPWGPLGGFGVFSSSLLAVIQLTPFGAEDRNSLLGSDDPMVLFIIGYVAAMASFYLVAPLYLQRFSAVNFQMSILTADVGVYLFNLFYIKVELSNIYMVGFFTVVTGLIFF